MRPLKLTLSAFGPYEQETVIDFTTLGDCSFFLIHGAGAIGRRRRHRQMPPLDLQGAILYRLFEQARQIDRLHVQVARLVGNGVQS